MRRQLTIVLILTMLAGCGGWRIPGLSAPQQAKADLQQGRIMANQIVEELYDVQTRLLDEDTITSAQGERVIERLDKISAILDDAGVLIRRLDVSDREALREEAAAMLAAAITEIASTVDEIRGPLIGAAISIFLLSQLDQLRKEFPQ